jgi:Mor family transcriptional regulator
MHMTNVAPMFPETKPDLVTLLLQQVIAMAPGFSEALARQIEADFRASHAGQSFVVLKRGPRLTPEQRQAVFQDGLSNMDNEEITEKHKISRRTLYRVMKDGGGRFRD